MNFIVRNEKLLESENARKLHVPCMSENQEQSLLKRGCLKIQCVSNLSFEISVGNVKVV